jgi:hypothetical protein
MRRDDSNRGGNEGQRVRRAHGLERVEERQQIQTTRGSMASISAALISSRDTSLVAWTSVEPRVRTNAISVNLFVGLYCCATEGIKTRATRQGSSHRWATHGSQVSELS